MQSTPLPPPITLSTINLSLNNNARNRTLLSKVPGPGLLRSFALGCNTAAYTGLLSAFYCSPALLSSTTNDTATTDLEGIPLWPHGSKSRGVIGLPLVVITAPQLWRPETPVPAGSYNIYFVLVNTTGSAVNYAVMCTYQPSPG